MTDDSTEARLRASVLCYHLNAICTRKDHLHGDNQEDDLETLLRYTAAKARVDRIAVCCAADADRGYCHLLPQACINCQENERAEADLAAIRKEIGDESH